MGLKQDIERAINAHNAEAGSDTPDFILAEYLTDCLAAFDRAVTARAKWYAPPNGEPPLGVPASDAPVTEAA